MSNAKITLYGFTRWMELNGKDLFEYLTLPAGIDKQLFTDNLMMEAGEFGVLYSDPELMAKMIGVWGRKHYRTFDKWITVLNKEYEPLYNLDVFEEWQEAGSRMDNASTNLIGGYTRGDSFERSESLEEDITDTNNLHNESEGSSTTENTRSAFDSNTYQPHDKQEVITSGSSDDTGDVIRDRDQSVVTTNEGSQTDEHRETKQDTSEGTTSNEHTGHRYGNQGVTMSQQMLQAELDVQRWNLYEHMTDLFIQDFCIAVYI